MKAYVFFTIVSSITLGGLMVALPDDVAEKAADATTIPAQVMLDEISSHGRLLNQLAAERFVANTNKNETWILTVHQGRSIRKYTDGKYIVLSLPAVESKDQIALCRYALHYNNFTLQAADLKVKKRDYKDAGKLYQLLLHFDRCDFMKEKLNARVACLEKLEKGQDIDLNLKRFEELYNDYFVPVDYSRIDKTAPAIVTNLLTIQLP